MKRMRTLSLLLIPIALAVSLLGFERNCFLSRADGDVNGFSNIGSSSASFTPLADGGVSLNMNYGDSFTYDGGVENDSVDFYIEFINDDVRFTFIVDDANGNHQDWIIMQRYWGGVNFQTMGYWGDPGHDNASGYQHFHIDFTDTGTKYYYNGYLITTSQVKKSAYAAGARLVFQLETNANFLAKIRVGKASFTDSRRTTIKNSEQDVSFGFKYCHATVSSLTLSGPANYNIPSDNYVLGNDRITISGEFIKESVNLGVYELHAIFGSDYASSTLVVAEKAEMELVGSSFDFDKHTDNQLTIDAYQNGDSFSEIVGNDIQSTDYSFNSSEEKIIINGSYLTTLSVGTHTFKAYSLYVTEGIDFEIKISDSTPPVCINNVKEYDAYLGNDVTFEFVLRENQLISVTGHDISNSDYLMNNNELTIKSQFLSKFNPLEVINLTANFTFGSVSLTINVISSEQAEILVNEQRINANSLTDAEYAVNIKYDSINSLTGNSITQNDWYYDTSRNYIVIKSSYIASLTVGTYTFYGQTHNNLSFSITLVVFAGEYPELIGASSLEFEKTTADEQTISFNINARGGAFISITENKAIVESYSINRTDGNDLLVFDKTHLLSLTNGEHNFVVKYDNGVVNISVTISNSAKPYYLNNLSKKYDVAISGNYEVSFNTNNGVFDKLMGNNISNQDYSFDKETKKLVISSTYLDRLDPQHAAPLRVVFDNGELSLFVSRESLTNYEDAFTPMLTWEEPTGSVITSSDDDGWVNVNYVRPKTADFAGGVKVKHALDVTKPITFFVDFISVPTLAGSSFALTLSNNDYKMYYDAGYGCSELFGVFGVGRTYLNSAYFGRPAVDSDPDKQIPHEFLKRSDLGYETFTFDIGEESTKIYINGLMIKETTLCTRSNFDNGLAYGLFTPHFWQDQEGTEFRIKLDNGSKPLNDLLILNKNSMNTLDLNVYIGSSVVRNVYLANDVQMLPLTGFQVAYDYKKGTARIMIPADAILYREGYDDTFDRIAIKTDQLLYVPLRLSNNETIDLYYNNSIFDVYHPNDCVFDYLKNNDTVLSIIGNGITSSDYGITSSRIVFRKEFLSTLDNGQHEFEIQTALGTETIIIKVVDSTAPEIEGGIQTFDINNPQSLTYRFVVPPHEKLEVKGNGITVSDYEINGNQVTIHEDFLQTLTVGKYQFSLLSYYADDFYSETVFEIEIVNSLKPSFNGQTVLSIDYNPNNKEPLTISVTENKGKLIEIEGGYITADNYKYDSGTITFYQDWLDTLPDGNTTLILKYDNGLLTVNINKLVIDEQPTKATDPNIPLYIVLGCSTAFCLTAALIFIITRRKKHEKTK